MTQYERMVAGLIYDPGDPEILGEQEPYQDKCREFNQLKPSQIKEKTTKMFGPNVTIATANHPIDAELRGKGYQYNKDVRIGANAWIGGNTVIVPGVTIGENAVIGGGSVVTKDIPANVVAVGNPCRVIREVGEHDREYFYKDEKIDWENL